MGSLTPMQHMFCGAAFKPLVAANGVADGATANGEWIPLTSLGGSRFLTFIIIAAAATGGIVNTGGTLKVQSSIDGSNGVVLKEQNGSTDLAFTASKLVSGAGLETNGFLIGTLDLIRMKHNQDPDALPTHVRLVFAPTGGTAQIAAAFVATHPVAHAALAGSNIYNDDDLLSKQHPA